MPDGGVYRAWKDGTAKVPGFLDDSACLTNALLDLYESCFEKRCLDRAAQLVELILEVILAGDKLGAAALVESVHRAYLPARVLTFAEDVPIGEGRNRVDGRPTACVCRNRTCDAPVTSVEALVERCTA